MRQRIGVMGRAMLNCKGVDQATFRKILWPQDYLMQWTDRYSLADIVDVKMEIDNEVAEGGGVSAKLTTVLDFCANHTAGCPRCAAACPQSALEEE